MQIALKLAEWVTDTGSDIPQEAIEKAKLSILDAVGSMIAGSREEFGAQVVGYIQEVGEKPRATVVGTPLVTSGRLAAFANGALGHCLDFGDISYSYIGFPSISVLPAALSVGESNNTSGRDILIAYLVGTEVACKLGAMVSPKLYEDGWHSTSVIGTFGATAAAGKLLKLSKSEMINAFAIAASEASGIRGNIGSMVKSVQVGRSAENGVVAGMLAKRGITGNASIFECQDGFCFTYKVNGDFAALAEKLGSPYDIVTPGFFIKQFPSGSATQAAISAMLRLTRKYAVAPEKVVSVKVMTTPLVARVLTNKDLRSGHEGKFSIRFCLALALIKKNISVRDFQNDRVSSPMVIETMRKITLSVCPALAKGGFAPQEGPEGAAIELTMEDGRKYQERALVPEWCPGRGPSWEQLIEKYKECVTPTLSNENIKKTIDVIFQLEKIKKIKRLTNLLKTSMTRRR